MTLKSAGGYKSTKHIQWENSIWRHDFKWTSFLGISSSDPITSSSDRDLV